MKKFKDKHVVGDNHIFPHDMLSIKYYRGSVGKDDEREVEGGGAYGWVFPLVTCLSSPKWLFVFCIHACRRALIVVALPNVPAREDQYLFCICFY